VSLHPIKCNGIEKMTKPSTDRKKKNEAAQWIHFTKKTCCGWGALFTAVSAFMFFVGVLVGRGNAPVHFDIDALQRDLAALKARSSRDDVVPPAALIPTFADKSDLEFYETLPAGEDTSFSDDFKKSGAEKDAAPWKQKQAMKTATMKKKSVPIVSQPASPSHTLPSVSKKVAVPAAKPVLHHHTIQVAALKDAEDAQQLLSRLLKKGYPAYRFSSKSSDGEKWHRVRVGSFQEKAAADALLYRLQREGFQGYVLRQ
jgi:cell division septation protein DedD